MRDALIHICLIFKRNPRSIFKARVKFVSAAQTRI